MLESEPAPVPLALDGATSRARAHAAIAHRFAAAGLDAPDRDARLLMEGVLGVSRLALLLAPDAPLGEAAGRLVEAARRRLAGEPVARVLGEWEFRGLPFRLAAATLVPRPDSETLVEAALGRLPNHGARLRLLDLGTGSGCLLVALLAALPSAVGIGVDRSPQAAATARDNARLNGVADRAAFLVADWAAPLGARFDLVVSNPPYIETAALAGLQPEVRDHDPRLALDGGADGRDAYRALAAALPRLLAPGGLAAVEIGSCQGASVPALFRAAGLDVEGPLPDLGGRDRVVVLRPARLAP